METIYQDLSNFLNKIGYLLLFAFLGVTTRILIKNRKEKLTKLGVFTSYFIGLSFSVIFGLFLSNYYNEVPVIAYAGAYICGKIGEDLSNYMITSFSEEKIKATLNEFLKWFKR